MTVTVHSKKPCVQCEATFRKLDKLGLAYTVVELTEESAARFKQFGHLSAPVVFAGTHSWAGYRPDLLQALAKLTPTPTEGEDPE